MSDNRQQHSDMEARILDTNGVQEALRQAAEDAIRRHVQAGRQIPIWRNNQVEWVTPEFDAAGNLKPELEP